MFAFADYPTNGLTCWCYTKSTSPAFYQSAGWQTTDEQVIEGWTHEASGFQGYYNPAKLPTPPAPVVMNVLAGDHVQGYSSMFADQSGNNNNVNSQSLPFDGQSITMSGQTLVTPDSDSLKFGAGSFSVSGWSKLTNVDYPQSAFIMKKGHGMYYAADREGWTPGWELGHGFQDTGVKFTGRDTDSTLEDGRKCSGVLQFDNGVTWTSMLNQWTHVMVVFNREAGSHGEAQLYLNGVKQASTVSLEQCQGSWDNTNNYDIGREYGWKTFGELTHFKVFNGAANAEQITAEATWPSGYS